MRHLRQEVSGNSLVEFAMIAPVAIMMIFGLTQLSQYIQTYNKVAQMGSFLGSSITAQTFTNTQISTFCTTSFRTLYPLNPAYAQIIISCVYNNNGTLIIPWQINQKGVNIPTQTSRIGQINSTPSLPTGFSLLSSQTALCVEVFFQFTPGIVSPYFGVLSQRTLYTVSVHVPRAGTMISLSP